MTEQQPDQGSDNPSAATWAQLWPADDPTRLETDTPTPRYARSESLIEWPPDPVTHEALVTHVEGEPADAARSAVLDEVRGIFDAPALTDPQVQGDVFVVPWPERTLPKLRAERVNDARGIDSRGRAVTDDGSHVLLPEPGSLTPPRYVHVGKEHTRGTGHTLGTLIVDPGSVARLAHDEHDDLLIGPGVYALHRQLVWQNRAAMPAAD